MWGRDCEAGKVGRAAGPGTEWLGCGSDCGLNSGDWLRVGTVGHAACWDSRAGLRAGLRVGTAGRDSSVGPGCGPGQYGRAVGWDSVVGPGCGVGIWVGKMGSGLRGQDDGQAEGLALGQWGHGAGPCCGSG